MSSILALICLLTPSAGAPLPLHVQGTQVLDSAGQTARLRGLNICSMEWTATGDHFLKSVGVALDQWHANIIRIPLNQDRWFGKTSDSPNGGSDYRALVQQAVEEISRHGSYAILDLHWSDGGEWGQNIGQHTLPDAHSIQFWKSCAAAYANNPAVIFDLYNEPIDASWPVWRDGGQVSEKFQGKDLSYKAVGLQTLLDTIRSTGAKNLIHAGGTGYSSRLDFPDTALLSDPNGNGVVYVSHFYPGWEDVPSWEARIEKASAKLPVFVEEFGDDQPSAPMDTPSHRIGQVLAVLKKNNFNWTAWCMHPAARPCVIADWDYHPTPEFGALIKTALAGKTVPIPPRRTVAADFKVYDGKLQDPWQSWSSATVNLTSPEKGHASATSIEVTLDPGKQLMLGTVPFDGLAYRSVTLWIKAAPGTQVNLALCANIMDKAQTSVNLPSVGDQWTQVTASFAQLGIEDKEDIKSFTIKNQDSGAGSKIYLDGVTILGNRE